MTELERRLSQGRTALSQHRLKEAHAAALEALRLDAASAEAFHLLGDIAWAQGAMAPAAQFFERAHGLNPTQPVPLARLSGALVALNDLAGARDAVQRAMALKPRDAFTLETLGVTLTRTGDYHAAIPLFERAATLAPRNTSALFNLGFGRQYVGDLAGAERAYRRVIEIDPSHADAYLALVEIKPQTPRQNLTAPLQKLFAKAGASPDQGLSIGHALAKSFEDLGDYPQALDWLKRAKTPRRLQNPYDPTRDIALFDAAQSSVPGDGVADASTDAPIFVIGMPRSGTTLTDRILSSHPLVGSLGEFQAFPLLLKQIAGDASIHLADPKAIERASTAELGGIGRAYMEAAKSLNPDRPRLVDKLPFNFFYAGLIHRALPGARIVCLRRDAMDVCLSNYRQLFGQESAFHDYGYDLGDIARYYVRFDRLIGHWRATLPADRFLELTYEDLVARQEEQTRRLLAFCDLPWDERCLDFHVNQAGVSTASASQVRQPLFTSAIGRWKRYGDGVEGAEAALRGAGLI